MQAQKLQLVAANRPETEFIHTNAFNPIQHLLCIKEADSSRPAGDNQHNCWSASGGCDLETFHRDGLIRRLLGIKIKPSN